MVVSEFSVVNPGVEGLVDVDVVVVVVVLVVDVDAAIVVVLSSVSS